MDMHLLFVSFLSDQTFNLISISANIYITKLFFRHSGGRPQLRKLNLNIIIYHDNLIHAMGAQ